MPTRPPRCSNCPFKTLTCGTKGPEDSPFVIIGESPGGSEIAKGIPFVGPSGTMLMDVLKEVGYVQGVDPEPYVLNALQCFPMGDKAAILQSATEACQDRVREQILAYPRQVILALGAAASWSTTNNFGIRVTRDRGKIIPSNLARGGIQLAVHPAYLMRNGVGLPFWKKDLKQAVDILHGQTPEGYWREPTWEIAETREDVQEYVSLYKAAGGLVTADVETDQLQQFHGSMLCIGLTKGDGSHVHIIPEELIYGNWDLFKELLEDPDIIWNWHNGKFDVRWWWHGRSGQYPRIDARVDEDTMLLSYALNSSPGFHDLDQVAQTWLSAPAHKGVVKKYLPNKNSSYRLIPPDVLYKYCAFDLSKQHRLHPVLWEAVQADGDRTVSLYKKLLTPSSMFFARVEEYGVEVSKETIEANEKYYTDELNRLDDDLQQYALKHMGTQINFGSYQQLQELMYLKMKLCPPGRIWNKESTDEKHLIEIQRKHNHPMIHTLLQRREVAKLKGTYVSNLLPDDKGTPSRLVCPDTRVRASFKVHGTITGRPACSDPNLLNVPRGPIIRSQYVAAPGKVFVEVDLNQAELRSLAVMSNDATLVKIYTENVTSIHDVTTAAFYGSKQEMIDDPEVLRTAIHQLQYFGEATPDKVYAEAKMRGKAVNFGIVYGREAHSLAQEFNISHQEAQRWIDLWFETYPGAKAYIDMCRATVVRQQTMITKFGRKKRVGVASPEKLHALQNEAANFPHQSTASDIMLDTALEVEFPLRERWGAYIWNEVYDAIYYEMDDDDKAIGESIAYVQSVIDRIPRDYGITRVPFIGDAKVGYDWGHMGDWKGNVKDSTSKFKLAA